MIVSGRQTPASERESQVSAEKKPLDSALAITDAAVLRMPGSLIHAPTELIVMPGVVMESLTAFFANHQVSRIHREVTRFSYFELGGSWGDGT